MASSTSSDALASLTSSGSLHALTLGASFTQDAANGGLHSVRYDFKPLSVDNRRPGVLNVDEENNRAVSISLPNADGHSSTNYSGHAKESNKKECVLLIDPDTGQITLERLSSQILVKKTRAERHSNCEALEEPISNVSNNAGNIVSSSGRNTLAPNLSASRSRPSTPQNIRSNADSNLNRRKERPSNNRPMVSTAVESRLEDDDELMMPSAFHNGNSEEATSKKSNLKVQKDGLDLSDSSDSSDDDQDHHKSRDNNNVVVNNSNDLGNGAAVNLDLNHSAESSDSDIDDPPALPPDFDPFAGHPSSMPSMLSPPPSGSNSCSPAMNNLASMGSVGNKGNNEVSQQRILNDDLLLSEESDDDL